MDLAPTDERPHPTADGGGWSESWSFDLVAPDGSLGAWVRFTRHATGVGRGHAWYHAMVTGAHRQLLAVIDHHVPFRSNPLELRTTGLWADHVCETAFDHWTLGLEAFALGVDDPRELYGRQHGDRVPLGFDLEWETDGPVLDLEIPGGVRGYEMGCRVHGEILIGSEVVDFEGRGGRDHAWGPLPWWNDQGWRLTGVVEGDRRVVADHRDGATEVRVVGADGAVDRLEGAAGELVADDDGLPASVRVEAADGFELMSEPIGVTPLEIVDGDRRVRRPRALARHRMADGALGLGWIEVRGPVAAIGSGP